MSSAADRFVAGMLNPDAYPHPCSTVQLVETHISWVFLTGLRAYKVKKPVLLEFADFSTLERRQICCREELRLNQRLNPDLYLDVVPITGSADRPVIDGEGTAFEYAVRMVQFNQAQLLSHLPPGALQRGHITGLADDCARFHMNAAVAQRSHGFASPQAVRSQMLANFDSLEQMTSTVSEQLARLRGSTEAQLQRLEAVIADRQSSDVIRECHGDLHLGNMLLHADRIMLFDGIEFNEELRWIDVINDIAFLIMDLEDRCYHRFGRHFLNRWLERTGDYAGLAVLRLYCAYRAMVRAKVDAIRLHQPHLAATTQRHLISDCRGYLNLAERWLEPLNCHLTITCGPSGSGKTTAAQQLAESGDAIHIRSDVERKRLFGLAPEESSDAELKQRMYSSEASRLTYERLQQLAEAIITAGYPVIVDAAFLRRHDRERFRELAERLSVPFRILKCSGSRQQLEQRIALRQRHGGDASEADTQVLSAQLQEYDPLSQEEQRCAVDAESPAAFDEQT